MVIGYYVYIDYMLSIQPADTIIISNSFKFSSKKDEYTYENLMNK